MSPSNDELLSVVLNLLVELHGLGRCKNIVAYGQFERNATDLFYEILGGLFKEDGRSPLVRPLPPLPVKGAEINLLRLYVGVLKNGGYAGVIEHGLWGVVADSIGCSQVDEERLRLIYALYLKDLTELLRTQQAAIPVSVCRNANAEILDPNSKTEKRKRPDASLKFQAEAECAIILEGKQQMVELKGRTRSLPETLRWLRSMARDPSYRPPTGSEANKYSIMVPRILTARMLMNCKQQDLRHKVRNMEYMSAEIAQYPLVAMRAFCALHRAQTLPEFSAMRSQEDSFTSTHSRRAAQLAKHLLGDNIRNDLLVSSDAFKEMCPSGIDHCVHLALKYSNFLFKIYSRRADKFFQMPADL